MHNSLRNNNINKLSVLASLEIEARLKLTIKNLPKMKYLRNYPCNKSLDLFFNIRTTTLLIVPLHETSSKRKMHGELPLIEKGNAFCLYRNYQNEIYAPYADQITKYIIDP